MIINQFRFQFLLNYFHKTFPLEGQQLEMHNLFLPRPAVCLEFSYTACTHLTSYSFQCTALFHLSPFVVKVQLELLLRFDLYIAAVCYETDLGFRLCVPCPGFSMTGKEDPEF